MKWIVAGLGLLLVILGVLGFFAFYVVGYLLGGEMIFTAGVFWPPLILAGIGTLLFGASRKMSDGRRR